MAMYIICKKCAASVFGSPDYQRLEAAIAEAKINLGQQTAASVATQHLKKAEEYMAEWNIQQSWGALMSAQRAMLLDPEDPDRLRRTAIMLRQEADKLSGWRARAIQDLICGPKGELLDELKKIDGAAVSSAMGKRVIDAVALRDDSANNTYLKISLRRRSLFQLFLVISIGILSFLVLSMLQMLPPPFSDPKAVSAAILFGVLGAALSVGLGLLSADVSAKVPSQQIGAFIIWMRPGIGAVAALVGLALIYANSNLKIFAFTSTDFSVIAVVAFAAGFSERFILGAIEKISQGKSKD
jgi:hypothetical protein